MATVLGLLLICLLMILPVLSTNRSERGGAELVHRSNWVQPLNRATVDSEAVHMVGYITQPKEGGYYGFTVTMDVYGFNLSPGQLNSYAGVWVKTDNNNDDGKESSFDGIQIGWRMSAAGAPTTGVDVYCPGFQPEKDASTRPSDVIPSISELNGTRQYIALKVFKDGASGDWLVHYGFNKNPELIGRLPKSIFTGLAYNATTLWFGGMGVDNATFQPSPALPPVGNGYMAVDGSRMAASMSNLQLIDEQGQASPMAKHLGGYSSNPKYYSYTRIVDDQFFYGGPLQSPTPSSVATSCAHNMYFIILLVLFTYWLF
uniref:Neprosin PEP catalytic domain-containing protein n=1 Tax=Oryza meridionalis TaxID=40149 RepID=A0A0E0E5G8_9ORYZ